MADQSANLATLRSSRHVTGVKFAFYKGTVAASGTVSATPEFGATSISVSFSVGSSSDIVRGMLVNIKTSGGLLKGRTHIRSSGTISSSSLPIREHSGKVAIASGDTWEALNEYPIVDKLVSATELFEPDYTTYTDQGSDPPPAPASGGHWAGKTDKGQSYATVPMRGTSSWVVDPDSASTPTHVWTLVAGVTFDTGSSSTDTNPTLRVTAGRYVISHAVTDPDNGKVTTQRIVLVCDDGSGTYAWDVLECGVTGAEQGLGSAYSSASVTLPFVASLSDLPDGSLAILYADDELIGDFANSYRNWNAARASILFVGYVRRDSVENDIEEGDTTRLDIISPMERLQEIVSYSKSMNSSATPDKWSKQKNLKVFRAMTQILQFYTTLFESGFDWTIIDASIDKEYPILYLQKSNFLGQLVELATGIRARVICDRTGRFSTSLHPALVDLSSRSSYPTTDSYTDSDLWAGYSIDRQQYEPIEKVFVRGFTGGSDPQPIAAVYPSNSPGMGTVNSTVERQIVTDLSDAKIGAGLYGAYNEGVIVTSTGARTYAPALDASLPGGYDHLDFGLEYLKFNLTTAREDVSAMLFYVQKWAVAYSEGTAEVNATFAAATYAGQGAQEVAGTAENPPPSDDPPVIPIIPNDNPGGVGAGIQDLAIFCVT